jgi:23S rRNA (uracil1939-C5)-methyltransferase
MHNFPFKLDELLDVTIEKLSFGGNGIARKNNVVIFVPFSAPGDELQIKITEIKKRHAIGDIVKILNPASAREKPICDVFGKCGGCNWQHLKYEEQLRAKQEIVGDFLKQVSPLESFSFLPIVPSPRSFNYRNRVQLKYRKQAKGSSFGFYGKGTHEIVNINTCPLMEKELSDLIPKKRIELEKSGVEEAPKVELSLFSSNLGDENSGFTQVNRFQNEALIKAVQEWAEPQNYDTIYDLYAGAGNFTFPLHSAAPKAKTVGVELHDGAAKLARERIKKMNIGPKTLEFFCSDVELFLKRQLIINSEKKSLVLLDPPRVGCSEFIMKSLALSGPDKILYISCDPAALARDLSWLFKYSAPNRTYKMTRAQSFDMFPQTHHVETLVELSLS